ALRASGTPACWPWRPFWRPGRGRDAPWERGLPGARSLRRLAPQPRSRSPRLRLSCLLVQPCSLSALDFDLTFSCHRQRPRDLALGPVQGGGVVQLAGGMLEAEPEQLLASGVDVLGELDVGVVT